MSDVHPIIPNYAADDRQVVLKPIPFLAGKKIAFCVSGGIACVEVVKIIRELRRYGAQIQVYATKNTFNFITPLVLEWASSNKVVCDFTGNALHIFTQDILLVCPATANILTKTCLGICDDVVSTIIASALGHLSVVLSKKNILDDQKNILPILMFPTMHKSLLQNILLSKHLQKLQMLGVTIIKMALDEEKEKLKIPSPQIVAVETIHHFNVWQNLKSTQYSVLITAGAVPTKIDNVRMLTNQASGSTGIQIADYFYKQGVNPYIVLPDNIKPYLPDYLLPFCFFFKYFAEYEEKIFYILQQKKPKAGIFSAAVSDFKLNNNINGLQNFNNKKISSNQDLFLKFITTPKIIKKVKEQFPKLLIVAFKYQVGIDKKQLFEIAHKMNNTYDFVVANLAEELNDSYKNRYWFAKGSSDHETLSTSYQLAQKIYEALQTK
jgi:phosphopantothenoylcysteine decarboxylase/phosphopantothenate--cysteine ligase